MIAFLKGKYVDADENSVVLENNGIGYRLLVSGSDLQKLVQKGEEIKLYTYMHVREDAIQLFGFLAKESLHMFRLLIRVSGVGPKGALGILTALDTDALRLAILSGDAKAIAKAPGIGAKTAGKVILELKDKVCAEEVFNGQNEDVQMSGNADPDVRNGAIEALTALGYSISQATLAVSKVQGENMSIEEILKQSLKIMV